MTLTEPDLSTLVDLPRPGGWLIRWRGSEWRDTDVTGQHLATLALLAGDDSFESLDVDPRHGHQRLMGMLTALVCVERAQDLEDVDQVAATLSAALDEVAKASADEILSALTFE
jgi:hypothetical protein